MKTLPRVQLIIFGAVCAILVAFVFFSMTPTETRNPYEQRVPTTPTTPADPFPTGEEMSPTTSPRGAAPICGDGVCEDIERECRSTSPMTMDCGPNYCEADCR